jgi:clan AA aspartic protease (TIGR02281 family)
MKHLCLVLILLIGSFLSHSQSYNYEQGVKAYDEGDLEKALDYFGREINDNPKSALALYYRAIIYKYQEENSFALRDINNAIKNISSKEKKLLAGALQLRGNIYYVIENYEKTFEDYAAAIKLTPNDPDLYTDRAQIYFEMQNFEKAEADYKQAIKIDESLVLPYTGLGRNFLNQKKYSESEKMLNQAIRLAPNYGDAYKFRARVYFEQNKYDDAIEDIFYAYLLDEDDRGKRSMFLTYASKNYPLAISKVSAQIGSNPEKELWYFVRAWLFENKYNYKAAISDYTKLIDMVNEEDKHSILSYRGKCYKNAGVYDKAIADYTESISLDSTIAFYYAYRGDVKRLQGDYKEAVKDFTKAIEIEPRQSWFYYRRGWIEEEFLKNIEAGLIDYNEAISLDKEYAYTYLHRGRLFETKLKNLSKANDDYNQIISLDTTPLESGNCRHYALFHLGRKNEAIAWLNKILEEYPTDGNYYDGACLYSLMNMPKEAIGKLRLSFENGYRDFVHLTQDDDLDNIKNLPEFKSLVDEYKKIFDEALKKDATVNKVPARSSNEVKTVSIPIKPTGGGTYEVSCKINDLKLNMIFDTGASDITISKTEAEFMLKNGYLSTNDITGTSNYRIANGDIEVGTTIVFRKVDFAGLVLYNVKASVIENKNAPLLFGQSALGKYGKITIDNQKKVISITSRSSN